MTSVTISPSATTLSPGCRATMRPSAGTLPRDGGHPSSISFPPVGGHSTVDEATRSGPHKIGTASRHAAATMASCGGAQQYTAIEVFWPTAEMTAAGPGVRFPSGVLRSALLGIDRHRSGVDEALHNRRGYDLVRDARRGGGWCCSRCKHIDRLSVSIPRQSRGLYLSEPLKAALRGPVTCTQVR